METLPTATDELNDGETLAEKQDSLVMPM